MSTECGVSRCGRPVSDQATVCGTCTGELRSVLAEIPWLVDDLDLVISRQTRYAPASGSRSSDKPVVFHVKASEVASDLFAKLHLWVGLLLEEYPGWDPPYGHRPSALSMWLRTRIET